MTKMVEILIPYLWPKQPKNHTLWGRTYLYIPYKGVPPGSTDDEVDSFPEVSDSDTDSEGEVDRSWNNTELDPPDQLAETCEISNRDNLPNHTNNNKTLR